MTSRRSYGARPPSREYRRTQWQMALLHRGVTCEAEAERLFGQDGVDAWRAIELARAER